MTLLAVQTERVEKESASVVLKGEVWSRPRLKECVRVKLEGMTETVFTCSVDGSLTALIPGEECLPPSAVISVPFLSSKCAGLSVLLDPAPNRLWKVLTHWKAQRELNPHESEAVALVPRWNGGSPWRRELVGWQLLHEFPAGTVLYQEKTQSDVDAVDCEGKDYPVQAWYCPPDTLPDGFERVLPGASVQAWTQSDDGPRQKTVRLNLNTVEHRCVGRCDCGVKLCAIKGGMAQGGKTLSVRQLARQGERDRRSAAASRVKAEVRTEECAGQEEPPPLEEDSDDELGEVDVPDVPENCMEVDLEHKSHEEGCGPIVCEDVPEAAVASGEIAHVTVNTTIDVDSAVPCATTLLHAITKVTSQSEIIENAERQARAQALSEGFPLNAREQSLLGPKPDVLADSALKNRKPPLVGEIAAENSAGKSNPAETAAENPAGKPVGFWWTRELVTRSSPRRWRSRSG